MANNHFVPVETQGPDIERDDDLSFDDDGIFDSTDSIFEGSQGDESEGVFQDRTSVFSTPKDPPEDHSNALTTREMTNRRYEDPKPPRSFPVARQVYNKRAGFKARPKGKRVLVARFNDQGQPTVACFQNGKQIEPFRAPTPQEIEALRTKGRLVKGSISGAEQTATGFPWKRIVVGGGAVLVAGGLAWYFWKKRKQKIESATTEDVAEASELE